ncbi:MAG: ribonuclease HI [Alphaproteobacteria bacterium 16-39-46]|nr:MAG: ribonuclease HI [Alphaproteobacteria bacterium 16-39-46]OZA42555.1 MAG: ribonuclease HI [Alphaproteobacteria bacterium 17-39-52]HQS83877.1 ribonuclease HI [Alphaproteobacteria bacterium]HQS93556.1 ribonuclease HI [Alphaproteobacteria bacterium]
MSHVKIYTDGACSGNPGPGGWGALLQFGDHEKEISGFEELTTNNRMELKAAIEALKSLKRICHVNLYTDSTYVRSGIMEWVHRWKINGWQTSDKKPVKNADLWEELVGLSERHHVIWHWVRGHSGHIENERVDLLARNAILQKKL